MQQTIFADDYTKLTLAVERPYIGAAPHPKMGELGNTLSRARRARAITLEDVERDTHVSRRYLQALENEDFSVFPAPVYTRGFLRTYARYLGLDPDELVRIFPNGDMDAEVTPLPSVSRPPEQLINVNWLVAGLVAIFLLGAGVLLLQTREDPNDGLGASLNSQVQARDVTTSQGGQVQAPPVTDATTTAQGKTIGPIRPGEYPNFVGADVVSALTILNENDMVYMIIEVNDENVAPGLIMSQSPGAGGETSETSAVTLVVSRGPAEEEPTPTE